jgi:hypothetical protein
MQQEVNGRIIYEDENSLLYGGNNRLDCGGLNSSSLGCRVFVHHFTFLQYNIRDWRDNFSLQILLNLIVCNLACITL